MTTEQWQIGDISITKLEEAVISFEVESYVERWMPGVTMDDINAIQWLRPTYIKDGHWDVPCLSFLVETPTHKILVDSGVGNCKKRSFSVFDEMSTDYLERLTRKWPIDEIDVVVATHLHVDHVGWNTTLSDGKWVPTFPNAEHIWVRAEVEYQADLVAELRSKGTDSGDAIGTWDDSVQPILDADLVTLVENDAAIAPGVTLLPTPGHTPGHVSVLIESMGSSAVITGDMMSGPYQIPRHDWNGNHEADSVQAAATRFEFVDRFADTSTIVIGSHFGTPAGGRIVREGSTYRFSPAAATPASDPLAVQS